MQPAEGMRVHQEPVACNAVLNGFPAGPACHGAVLCHNSSSLPPSVCLSIRLSISQSVCLCLCLCLSVYLSLSLSLSVYLSLSLSVCLSFCLSACLSVCLSVCPPPPCWALLCDADT